MKAKVLEITFSLAMFSRTTSNPFSLAKIIVVSICNRRVDLDE